VIEKILAHLDAKAAGQAGRLGKRGFAAESVSTGHT
jgi:hypothetical protein